VARDAPGISDSIHARVDHGVTPRQRYPGKATALPKYLVLPRGLGSIARMWPFDTITEAKESVCSKQQAL
jgi:hypothetical protein